MKMNLLKRAILAMAIMVCSVNVCGQYTSRTYMLVTDENQLEEGPYLIVGYKSQESTNANTNETSPKGYYGLGLQNTNNRLGIHISDEPPIVKIIHIEIASHNLDTKPFEITIRKDEGDNFGSGWTLYDAVNNAYLGPQQGNGSTNALKGSVKTPAYTISIAQTGIATITCFGDESNTDGIGRNTIQFFQGNSIISPLFSSYRGNQQDIYLYKYVDMREFWLPEDQTASFADNAWRVKFAGNEDWEKDENGYLLVSIPQNNSRVQKIKISGNATTGNNTASSYVTNVLEIDRKGTLDVSGGALHVAEKVVMLSDDNHSAQLKSTNGTLTANELHVKKTFRNAAWYHVSFPFDVEKIYLDKEDGSPTQEVIVNPNTTGTGRGVWAKYYSGEARALADRDPEHYNQESSINWISILEGAKLEKNKGYQLGQNHGFQSVDTLIFVSKSPAPDSAWAAVEKSYEVTLHPASIYHRGWNLIGNPHTFSYDLQHKLSHYITYVYNENDYIEDTEIIQPFKAFFVQVEEESISFDSHSDVAMLRSLSIAPYEQIRLSITKDNFFYDYFNLRIGGDNTTTGFDFNRDAHKMLSSVNPQLYSRYYGVDYAINAIPDTENSIPLAYKVSSAGSYTIRLDENNLSGNIIKLLLLDKEKDDLITDLLITPFYEFSTAGAQTNTTRFELLFKLFGDDEREPVMLVSCAATGNRIEIFVENKQLILNGLEALSTVTLYDVAGKMIHTITKVDNHQPITINNLPTGIYIVKIENEKQIEITKVAVK